MTTGVIDRIAGFTALPSPHLQVIGARAGEMTRALLSRIAPQARVVMLADSSDAPVIGPHAHRARAFDLVGALAGPEGLAVVREQLLRAAASIGVTKHQHDDGVSADNTSRGGRLNAEQLQGQAVAKTIVQTIDDHIRLAATVETASDVQAVSLRCPPHTSDLAIVATIEDMIAHAQQRGLPAPTARIVRGCVTVLRTANEAKIDLARGAVETGTLRIQLAVAHPEDWRPYEARGWEPDLPEAVLNMEIELEVERLSVQPEFARGDADSIRDLAAQLVDDRRWSIAIARSSAATQTGRASDAQTLLGLLGEEPGLPKEAAAAVASALGGGEPTPAWWDADLAWVDVAGEPAARLEALIESLATRAQHQAVFSFPKVLVVDLAPFVAARSQDGITAIGRLLRTGRKLRLSVVLLSARAVRELDAITHLIPNWLTSDEERGALPLLRAAGITGPGGSEGGWWQSSASDAPIALDPWYSADDLAAGTRLLQGVPDASRA